MQTDVEMGKVLTTPTIPAHSGPPPHTPQSVSGTEFQQQIIGQQMIGQ